MRKPADEKKLQQAEQQNTGMKAVFKKQVERIYRNVNILNWY